MSPYFELNAICFQWGSKGKKLDWPLVKSTKEKFRELSEGGYNYEKLINLIPKYDEEKTCECGHKYDPGCPVKNYWIQSKEIRIHNKEWVNKKTRIVYYRPTVMKTCDHKDT